MIENKYPIFKKGSLVEKIELDLLRDNPYEILNLMYLDKKDGIIKGFEIETDKDKNEVKITKGIAKYNEKLYWLNTDYIFEMPDVEAKYILKLKLEEEIEEKKFYVRKGLFLLEKIDENDFNVQSKNNEIEITRFITRIGAELRNDYQNFNDLRRDFNLLEIINTKYSSMHELGTLHPKILKLWGIDASKKENLDLFDINFYINCLQGEMEREVIVAYINLKLNLYRNDYSNEELYENLKKILENLGNERKQVEKKRIIPKKITIE